jgi:hypothetical protein
VILEVKLQPVFSINRKLVVKNKKSMGVQQVLLSPDNEIKAILEYLCQQSGKLYNSGVYFARQTFFKTGKLLTGKFDLAYEPSVAKTMVAQSMPSVRFVVS